MKSRVVPVLIQLLKMARLAKGMSQYELAKLIGVSQGRIWDLENGRTEPTIPTFEKWADALELDLDFMLTSRVRRKESITGPRTEWYGTAKELDDTLNGGK